MPVIKVRKSFGYFREPFSSKAFPALAGLVALLLSMVSLAQAPSSEVEVSHMIPSEELTAFVSFGESRIKGIPYEYEVRIVNTSDHLSQLVLTFSDHRVFTVIRLRDDEGNTVLSSRERMEALSQDPSYRPEVIETQLGPGMSMTFSIDISEVIRNPAVDLSGNLTVAINGTIRFDSWEDGASPPQEFYRSKSLAFNYTSPAFRVE